MGPQGIPGAAGKSGLTQDTGNAEAEDALKGAPAVAAWRSPRHPCGALATVFPSPWPTGTGTGGSTIWSNNPYPLEADSSLRHYAGALCAAFAQGGEVTGGNSQFYFVTALPNSVDETMQQQLRDNGYSDEQVSAYAAAGGLPYLDNTDTVFGQVYAGMDVVDQIACVPTVKNEDETDTYRPQEDSTVTIYKVTIDNYPGPSADDTADSAASDSSAQ